MGSYECCVVKYIIGHGELTVCINPAGQMVGGDKTCLLFKHTVYFEGPFAWQGVNFSMSPLLKHPDLVSKIPNLLPSSPYPNSTYYDYLTLFQIDSGNISVKIVAQHVIRIED